VFNIIGIGFMIIFYVNISGYKRIYITKRNSGNGGSFVTVGYSDC